MEDLLSDLEPAITCGSKMPVCKAFSFWRLLVFLAKRRCEFEGRAHNNCFYCFTYANKFVYISTSNHFTNYEVYIIHPVV